MKRIRIAYYFTLLLPLLESCETTPATSASEFSRQIEAARETKSPEQRLALIDSAIAAYPEEPYFYFERGICKSHLANDTGEIADLSRAIQLSREKDCETYLRALTVRGFRWMHQGKHKAAFDDFWEAATPRLACEQASSKRLSHYWNAGLVARMQLRLDLVESVMQGMKGIDSTSTLFKTLQAETYRLRDRPKEALVAYDILLQDSSERDDYHLWMGRAKTLASLGKDKEAQQNLATAKVLVDAHILRTGDSLAFSDPLAEISFLRDDYAAAITICERFLPAGDPLHRSMLHCTHGDAMQAMGNTAQACADWEKSTALGWGEARQRLEKYCNK